MEILLKNISEIIDDKFTVYQRGLLITILLVREKDPKLTLAKFKAKVNMKEAKSDLLLLHKKKVIKWSGYASAERSLNKEKDDPRVKEVIDFMNNLYGRKFDHKSESTTKNLRNRLQQYSVKDIKRVVANRYEEWKDDPVMHIHLRPSTIFRPSKFDKYLEEVNSTGKGEGITTAQEFGLRQGDEIDVNNSNILVDSELYNIKTYLPDFFNKPVGNGKKERIYGKDLKMRIKLQQNKVNNGGIREFIFTYQSK